MGFPLWCGIRGRWRRWQHPSNPSPSHLASPQAIQHPCKAKHHIRRICTPDWRIVLPRALAPSYYYCIANHQFVSGSDDFQLRVYNISTGEKITSFEAHPDYIRCLTVHPTLSLVLTGSDDMTIKCWDWDKGWRCVQVSDGFSCLGV